jgi:NAD(P)-dependent dehydrogenase (short-subunit alcohol dehydrogenase family)
MTLDGKVAVLTGGSRGLGRRLARALADAGLRVALLARPSAALDETAAALGERAIAIPTDVADPASVNAAFAETARRLGRIDVLVNNAAVFEPFRLEVATDEQILRHYATNLLGAVWCCRAVIPHLKAAGGGDIVNVSSRSVQVRTPMLSVYASTKGGLESLSLSLREEVRKDGIRVTILRVGAFSGGEASTGWPAEINTEFRAAMQASGVALRSGAPAAPESIAQVLVDLVSLPRDVNIELIDAFPA